MNLLKIDSLTDKERKRIERHLEVNVANGCWLWTGSLDSGGYAQGYFRGRKEKVHRIMYAAYVGPIPRGENVTPEAEIDHLCRNRNCCNPAHMQLVTHRENVLRGVSAVATGFKKTHCNRGHLLPARKPDGTRGPCKVCESIRHASRMSGPNRDYWLKKAREAAKRYRDRHPDRSREATRRCRQKHAAK